MNRDSFLWGIALNQSITNLEFHHWFALVSALMELLISSKYVLLIFPTSDLHGFSKRHATVFEKFGLWSLMVINAGFSAMH